MPLPGGDPIATSTNPHTKAADPTTGFHCCLAKLERRGLLPPINAKFKDAVKAILGTPLRKAPWRRIIGLAVIALGIGWTARGLCQWNEPPLDPGRRYLYVTSRQIEDVTFGPMCVLIGIVVCRRGLGVFDR